LRYTQGPRAGSIPVLTTKIKVMKEILIYGIVLIFVVYFTIGLFGGYDTDKDNPWKKK